MQALSPVTAGGYSFTVTFAILKLVELVIALRMSEVHDVPREICPVFLARL
jgi:ammonia channel protein AmtB